jgi:hypothetical protein
MIFLVSTSCFGGRNYVCVQPPVHRAGKLKRTEQSVFQIPVHKIDDSVEENLEAVHTLPCELWVARKVCCLFAAHSFIWFVEIWDLVEVSGLKE